MTSENIEPESYRSKVVLEMDAFPFKGLNISEDWKKLESIEGRTICSSCKKSRKYFCYTCYIPVPEISGFMPKVKLPIKVDIIKHAREMDGKSTAVGAAVLAPEDIRVFTFPSMPDYPPHENVVLIFPNKDAVSVEEACERFMRSQGSEPAAKRLCSENSSSVVHRAVFIDSTWNQSRGIFKDPRIKKLCSVVLRSRLSQFWRHQTDSPRWYLATVEAIHQFLLELDRAQWTIRQRSSARLHSDGSIGTSEMHSGGLPGQSRDKVGCESDGKSGCVEGVHEEPSTTESGSGGRESGRSLKDNTQSEYCYRGQYDNLLFFFRFMYSKIHTLYEHDQLKSYKRRLE